MADAGNNNVLTAAAPGASPAAAGKSREPSQDEIDAVELLYDVVRHINDYGQLDCTDGLVDDIEIFLGLHKRASEPEKPSSFEGVNNEGHTPTPWYVGAQNDILYIIDKPPRPAPVDYPADIPGLSLIAKVMSVGDFETERANANLIVTAVNSHAHLLACREALKDLVARINELDASTRDQIGSRLLHIADSALSSSERDGG